MNDQIQHLIKNDAAIPWTELGSGVRRKIMTYDDQIMLVKVDFELGAFGASHSHRHTQITYVSAGIFEVEIEGKKQIANIGDVFYIPSNAIHGVVCLEKGELVDIFTPCREDFL